VSAENGKAVVVIGDNGGGIADEHLDRVFDPYFSTREEGMGTGIGLYMSKTIIEQSMAGTLSVRNTPEGAEFRIEVPHES
jgi:signal transduction histidine kinase